MLSIVLMIFSGNAALFLFTLIRNLIIARLITVADFGIAATFLMATALVEMISAFGLQQQIVQAKDGDDSRLQAGLQGFQLLRGVLSGLALFLLAPPLAEFLRMPEVTWAYQVLAVVPVLVALQHFDIHRLNRQMRFGPLILTNAVPAFISLLAIWPLSYWFLDYRLMLAAILIQMTLAAIASHLVAERRYEILLDREILRRGLSFGWPLLVNNVLLFLVFQGDKLIVGRELGAEALAIFAMGVTLTLSPTLIFNRSLQNFFLPQLSAAQDRPEELAMLAAVAMQAVLVFGALFVFLVVLVGQPVVYLLLGDKYADLLPLLTLFAIWQAIRVLKAGPGVVALSVGETKNAMFANIGRVALLPLAWYAALATGDLRLILWIAIAGECVAHAIALWRLARIPGFTLPGFFWPHLAGAACLACAAVHATAYAAGAGAAAFPWGLALFWGAAAVSVGALGLAIPELRRFALTRTPVLPDLPGQTRP